MSRLIDADALLERMRAYANDDWNISLGGLFTDTVDTCIDFVECAETIEAVPVVQGEWVSLTDCSNAGVYCSVCYKKVWKEDYAWCNRKNKLRSNFCPNCGAKMKGGA